MKYWRGYLVAGLLAALGWGLTEFARNHVTLMDMVYPYMSRMIVTSMADWSANVDFCVWQVLLVVGIVAILATAVLMLVLKWNPIQWLGWVLAAVALVSVLNTGVYELNAYTGDLNEDLRLTVQEYNISDLETAALHFQKKANEWCGQVKRDSNGHVYHSDFAQLAEQAGDGFEFLTYEEGLSVFAGSRMPVKQLGMEQLFPDVAGMTVGLTGESAINPNVPHALQPFVICREMSRRMSIYHERDASFASITACIVNENPAYRYSGYLTAYYFCREALAAETTTTGKAAYMRVIEKEDAKVTKDLETYGNWLGEYIPDPEQTQIHDLMVSWYINEYVLPNLIVEEELFDPMDKTQVDLSTTIVDITETEDDDE